MELWMWKSLAGLGMLCALIYWGDKLNWIKGIREYIDLNKLATAGVVIILVIKICAIHFNKLKSAPVMDQGPVAESTSTINTNSGPRPGYASSMKVELHFPVLNKLMESFGFSNKKNNAQMIKEWKASRQEPAL